MLLYLTTKNEVSLEIVRNVLVRKSRTRPFIEFFIFGKENVFEKKVLVIDIIIIQNL